MHIWRSTKQRGNTNGYSKKWMYLSDINCTAKKSNKGLKAHDDKYNLIFMNVRIYIVLKQDNVLTKKKSDVQFTSK